MEFIDDVENPIHHGDFKPRHIANIDRQRQLFDDHLYNDYLVHDHVFLKESKFRWQFQMLRPLFFKIMHKMTKYDNYFVQERDDLG